MKVALAAHGDAGRGQRRPPASSGSTSPADERSWATAILALFDLSLSARLRLEIRLPREDEFGALLAVIEDGIHDPSTMPFGHPWTDLPRVRRERESAQWWWRQRAEWSVHNWSFVGAVYVDGQVVGVQDMLAVNFAQLRSVTTGSWLGRRHQGQGLGKEMRQAILHLAFAGLGRPKRRSAGPSTTMRPRSGPRAPSAIWTTASSAPPEGTEWGAWSTCAWTVSGGVPPAGTTLH